MKKKTKIHFKIGDVVQLKSGGVKMVINDTNMALGEPMIVCNWFNKNNELQINSFNIDTIKIYEKTN